MLTIWKEYTIQDRLNTLYDQLVIENDKIREELHISRKNYNQICNEHIYSGFRLELEWMEATKKHQFKFLEYDAHCFLIDVISDYRDVEGKFGLYKEMAASLERSMHMFAKEEKYEISAIIKRWLVKLYKSIDV